MLREVCLVSQLFAQCTVAPSFIETIARSLLRNKQMVFVLQSFHNLHPFTVPDLLFDGN